MSLARSVATFLLPALLSSSFLASPAFAGETLVGGKLFSHEPLVRPSVNRAVIRAQAVLREAHARLAAHADGQPAPTIGFLGARLRLGALAFRNPKVLYQGKGAERSFIGYLFEMKIGAEAQRSWQPVIIGRHGAIANPLFSGGESLFALAASELPAEALAEVASEDLAQRRPLDQRAAWLARSQRGLNHWMPPAKSAVPVAPAVKAAAPIVAPN